MGSQRRRTVLGLVVTAVGAVAIVTAQAVDQPIGAIKLIMKISPSGSEKMVFVAKDPAFLFPPLGSLDDPANGSPGGAIIDILTRDGGDVTFIVPPGESAPPGWKAKDGASVDLYKYVNKDAPGGPTELKVVVLKETKVLKLVGKAAGLPLTGTLGDVVVRVTTGSLRNCARFDAATIRRDEPGKFIAKGALASSLTDCASGPPTTSTSTTTSSSTSSSTSSTTTTSTSSTSTTSTSTSSTSTSSTTSTSSSTSSTTTTSTSSTTSTSLVLSFTTLAAGGFCGEARMGGAAGTILKNLTCGGLNIGGGCSQEGGSCGVNEGPTPAGATTTFKASCPGSTCTITARTAAESGSNNDCSDTGCQFGTWLSIANGGTSTCVLNTFQSPGSGTLDLVTGAFDGSIPLTSAVTLTGNGAAPCPLCLVGGMPGQGPGTCSGAAANPGAACVGTNPSGDNYECLPSGFPLTPFGVDLTPISTGTTFMDTTTDQDKVPGGVAGEFCPGQDLIEPGTIGCFGLAKTIDEPPAGPGGPGAENPVCDYIEERGSPAAGITIGGGPVAATLGSVFCIPAAGNGLIDGAADLPGPGATTLPGTLTLIP
ncbi:MAG TPA: hypothetical protein VF044_04020 [Actinomycetota bacterium]